MSQFAFHLVFGAAAIATGHWFLIVVVSLPQFYGGKWYHQWIHDTMHVGREPECDDFRKCCRTVKIDPFSSFMYWHMEWHVEHHTYAAIPCYNLKRFHEATAEHWDPPQTLGEAWREIDEHSRKLLRLA
jgi:fatty acid desaturase